ncbi:MAG: ABC-type dipeptide/oligopeptide/nickel transport system, permease component [Acidimicrobiales bacterium]|nr:ABC-type dipeptide/oligopeptide/nickel transport system, permease component [Acidimicrobiales bacterium]
MTTPEFSPGLHGDVGIASPVDVEPAETLDAGPAPKKKLGASAWLSIGWLGLLTFTSVFASVLPIEDPNAQATDTPLLAPGQGELLLGADGNGRDMLARLIWGTRVSLEVGFAAVAVGFVIGGLLGLFAGYYRNWIGKVLAGLFDILLAIPALVLVLALVAVLKGDPTKDEALPGVVILIIAIGLVSIPLLARITRAQTLAWSQREFVLAAKAQGAGSGRILFREILPNVLPAMGYIALLGVGIAIVAEGAAALFGASVNPPQATLGVMINSGRGDMEDAPFVLFLPILVIFLTVMALNFLGDVVRDRFDVRESAL